MALTYTSLAASRVKQTLLHWDAAWVPIKLAWTRGKQRAAFAMVVGSSAVTHTFHEENLLHDAGQLIAVSPDVCTW